MRIQELKDQDLLTRTRELVQQERETLTEVLHHLKEIERRKLYSDLGFRSLFDYAVKELKYSESQAGRRIQAMRLILDLPQVEKKIERGELNLSHACQAQSFFYQTQKANPKMKLSQDEKLALLRDLENKSARQTQVLLLEKSIERAQKLGADLPLPKERERILSHEHCEVRLVISQDLRRQLEDVRSLLGAKAVGMSLAQLMSEMANLSLNALKDKRFGKRRDSRSSDSRTASLPGDINAKAITAATLTATTPPTATTLTTTTLTTTTPTATTEKADRVTDEDRTDSCAGKDCNGTSASKTGRPSERNTFHCTTKKDNRLKSKSSTYKCESPAPKDNSGLEGDLATTLRRHRVSEVPLRARSISKGKRYRVWQRDGGSCVKCGSKDCLQVDHIVPVALGGGCEEENLRLLCANCNLREGIKDFGLGKMKRGHSQSLMGEDLQR